ncbi:MAG: HIT domain-containing protein [Puniceicoccales bacterium]|jgi:diadenosine tetraphosphate (Ap4A) HIT family hydrolase|nr:HIT domain-containing protein [Puniceicoccales bacterium]
MEDVILDKMLSGARSILVMSNFALLKQFSAKPHICDLSLSRVLLNDTAIPWIFLIPMRDNVLQMNHLSEVDQRQLMAEINIASNAMESIFPCTRLNVAAIGNKTPQLHIHVICRTENDAHWPETVWQYSCAKMTGDECEIRRKAIEDALRLKISQ